MQSENEPVNVILHQLLVHALLAGCNHQDAIAVIYEAHCLDALEIHYFIRECGVFFPHAIKPDDMKISEERRRQLQELSTSDL